MEKEIYKLHTIEFHEDMDEWRAFLHGQLVFADISKKEVKKSIDKATKIKFTPIDAVQVRAGDEFRDITITSGYPDGSCWISFIGHDGRLKREKTSTYSRLKLILKPLTKDAEERIKKIKLFQEEILLIQKTIDKTMEGLKTIDSNEVVIKAVGEGK